MQYSYLPDPKRPADYALKQIDLDWSDGGALGDKALPAKLVKVSDLRRHAVVAAKISGVSIKAVITGEPPMQGAATH